MRAPTILGRGEDGIRTHAPFRTNGFQDRLVMTTSIPLRMIFPAGSVNTARIILSSAIILCQYHFTARIISLQTGTYMEDHAYL